MNLWGFWLEVLVQSESHAGPCVGKKQMLERLQLYTADVKASGLSESRNIRMLEMLEVL